MALNAHSGAGPNHTIGYFGAQVGRGRVQPERLIHQNAEAPVAAHQYGEFFRAVRIRGGGHVQNPLRVFEEALHSRSLIGRAPVRFEYFFERRIVSRFAASC
jgi:hypothetical protein